MTSSTALWYLSRATGIVCLLLFTATLLLGLLVTRQGRLPGLPGFAVTSLHRNLSLIGLSFVALHVLTVLLDTYVRIPLVAVVLPFTSGYERFWLGLGAVALDLAVAIVVTSLVRGRIPRSWWRPVHLLAYLCWPLALAHGMGAARDLRQGWLLELAIGCALVAAGATAWRLAAAARQVPRAGRVATMFAQHAKRSAGPGQASSGRPSR
jgi:sulfoxide reductase heme-binding subunit YedZ